MDPKEKEKEKIEEEGYYIIEDDEKEENVQPSSNAWNLFFNVLYRPIEGWKRVKSSKITIDKFAQSCFYPTIALCALLNFIELFYNPEATLQTTLIESLFIFLSFFLGYFIAVVLVKFLLPSEKAIFDENFGKIFIMVSMTSLAFFTIFMIIFPVLDSILIFLSLYTIYIINKGIKILRVDSSKIVKSNIVLIALVVGLPILLKYLFNIIYPLTEA